MFEDYNEELKKELNKTPLIYKRDEDEFNKIIDKLSKEVMGEWKNQY